MTRRTPTLAAAPWAPDAVLAVLLAAALALVMATTDGGTRPPDLRAYAFAVGLGSLLLLRRRLPRTVLVLTTLATFAYYTFDYPPIGVALPVLAALFSAAERGLVLWPVGTAVVVLTVATAFRIRDDDVPLGTLLGYESIANVALFAAAVVVGHLVRSRRLATEQRARIAELTEAQLRRETELQVRAERERISRELHDTVGHTLSVISLQAGVAEEAVGHDDAAAAQAVGRIREASRASLAELRSLVRLLRRSEEDGDRLLSLAAVGDLTEAAAATGLDVRTRVTVPDGALSPTVDAAAYRVVQESLTNIIRHARAAHAEVRAEVVDGRLLVRVSDDGNGPVAGTDTGAGLLGMTERVRLLGGTLSAAGEPGKGFTVEARMPTRIDR
ncbi:sensor histidine kinase [Desertihabitans aurantiacus]|uniref:sensor histidine kinase n=1 Tax=Desertihabitans aurantiacus TaxID=2282477 RepID=UPI000DF741A6|nr:sensor histidine kinase [Desertihabitans aurantiacus]